MASIWSRIESTFFKKYLKNPTMLSGPRWKKLEEKSRFFKWWNNALNAAPGFKWALSIVPLYGVLIGNPPVEKIDIKQSIALTFTGSVWSYYALLVKPTAYLLMACNLALLGVHGYNITRRVKYDQKHGIKHW